MRVAVCDDHPEEAEALRKLLKNSGLVNQVRCFIQPDGLRKAVRRGERFDAALMDIDWNLPVSGFQLAEQLQGDAPAMQIIFVTGYNDRFADQVMLTHANLCGYITKPVNEELLIRYLLRVREKQKEWEGKTLLVSRKGLTEAIPVREICYLESSGHQLMIHTGDTCICCYERLVDVMERLPRNFYQCHKSYAVNMDCIRRIDKNWLVLKNEEQVPISKARYAQTRTVCFRYMGEQL